jgi:L-serine dehydratase
MDWVMLFALAVNEQNAAGGRIVTAPTNGAAGIVPAVLHYYARFVPGATTTGSSASCSPRPRSGSCSRRTPPSRAPRSAARARSAPPARWPRPGWPRARRHPEQVENAAEIGMEHNLGLTCDPIGGLVQIPCIERNAVASVKAITAARMALRGDGEHHVSLDKVIRTMRDTGADMKAKYKETSRGGLAVNLIEC